MCFVPYVSHPHLCVDVILSVGKKPPEVKWDFRENQGDFTFTAKHLLGSVYKDTKEFRKIASTVE